MLNLKEAVKAANAKLLNPQAKLPLSLGTLQYDSRLLKKSDIFVAVPGEVRDGHEFLLDAVSKGAIAALVAKSEFKKVSIETKKIILQKLWILECKDTVASMGKIAKAWRKKLPVLIIGITGSNGKTTTKDILGSILQQALGENKVLVSQSSLNNHLGVPHTISKLTKQHKAAVLEMGTNHPGEIAYLVNIAQPNAGLITNIGDSHLEFMGSRAGIFKEKKVLLDSVVGTKKCWLINHDDVFIKKLEKVRATGIKKITYSMTDKNADFYVKVIKELDVEDNFGYILEFSGKLLQKKYQAIFPVPGEHNIQNALAAYAAAVGYFQKSPEAIAQALTKIKLSSKRSEVIKLRNGAYIFNDCYNANPTSMRQALAMLVKAAKNSPFFVALGEMKEMGAKSSEVHYELGKNVGDAHPLALAVCGEHAHDVAKGARAAGLKNIQLGENPEALAPFLKKVLKGGSFLLVKGSRGAKMEKLVDLLQAEL